MKMPRLTRNRRGPSAVRPMAAAVVPELDAETQHVYRKALEALGHAGVEFLIGGAYALAPYTNVVRDTKDLDVFLRREDCEAAFAALVAHLFSMRRKTLGRALKGRLTGEQIESAGIDPIARPETLAPSDFARLASLAG